MASRGKHGRSEHGRSEPYDYFGSKNHLPRLSHKLNSSSVLSTCQNFAGFAKLISMNLRDPFLAKDCHTKTQDV